MWMDNTGACSNLDLFEAEHTRLQHEIRDNWLYLKENGNAYTWKSTFREANLLTGYEIELDKPLKRAQLAELLLIKCIQNVKTQEDIRVIRSVIFQNCQVPATVHEKGTENALFKESLEEINLHTQILSRKRNREQIEDILNREEVITIKDHLLQNRIIDLKENEKLLKLEKSFGDGKTNLTVRLIDLIINKLSSGSYQCLIQSLHTINDKEVSRPRVIQLIHTLECDSIDEELPSGSNHKHTVNVEEVGFAFYENDIEGKDNFIIRLTAENWRGQEVKEVYEPLKRQLKDVNRILSSQLGASLSKVSNGSLVIDMQMLERNMQDYLKYCLKRGRVTTVVQTLFSEISMENIIPYGELHLKVKIEVNDNSSLLEPRSDRFPDISMFVVDNRSFLLEEMDTDAMEIALERIDNGILTNKQCKGRREKADHILNSLVTKRHHTLFRLVIEENAGNTFDYLRRRLQEYTQVYKAELQILRKNILLQFLQIVRKIDIDNVREVLLERKTVELSILYDIDYKCLTKREIGMATLLLIILKSDYAVRAFVDALFVVNSALAKPMLRCHSELSVTETGSMVEIHEKSNNSRLLVEGHFTIEVIQKDFEFSNILLPSQRHDPFKSYFRNLLAQISSRPRRSLHIKLIQFEKKLLEWLVEAKLVIETLEVLAEELDAHFTRISKAKIGGSAVGIVGSVIGIVGIALTPFTFGASLGLTIAGGIVATAGGATVGGSLIADNVLSRQTMTKAKEQLSAYSRSSITIKETCLLMSRQLEKIEQSENHFLHWIRFWTKFVRGQESNTNKFSWKQTQRLLMKSLDDLDPAARFVSGEGIGSGVKIAGAAFRITGSSLHVASGIIGALMIPLDIFTLIDSAIDVHKKNKHETSKLIIQISQTLAAELPTKESIKNMIEFTIYSI